ncbi:hypothetical protein Baya_16392 [Bagarius yarrelli]|uniref:Uncharacterized protein n=1 Tax=Bagarius yarrelli TaxID=175774 RepID=A0A556VVA4_BAGYA|nr:hypothetical protein Baya_16392 [Bagarius yarrelli]
MKPGMSVFGGFSLDSIYHKLREHGEEQKAINTAAVSAGYQPGISRVSAGYQPVSAYQPRISRSAGYQPGISRYQPGISHVSAGISRVSAMYQPGISPRNQPGISRVSAAYQPVSAAYQPGISRVSAAYQPRISRVSAAISPSATRVSAAAAYQPRYQPCQPRIREPRIQPVSAYQPRVCLCLLAFTILPQENLQQALSSLALATQH